MKNNSDMTPKHKLLGLKVAQRLMPQLAYKMALELFFTPINFPTKEEEFDYKRDLPIHREVVDGKRITTYLGGAPPFKVLLVHGWSGRASQFMHLGTALKEAGISYISFTAPAHGSSTDKHTHMLEFAHCIEHLNRLYEPFDAIIGHSLGGTALMNAMTMGVTPKKVVLIGSHATITASIKDFVNRLELNPSIEEKLFKHLQVNYHRDFEKYGVERLAESFKGEALVVHDEQDTQCDYTNAKIIADAFPTAELMTTSGYGHTRILANKEVVRRITDFVSSSS